MQKGMRSFIYQFMSLPRYDAIRILNGLGLINDADISELGRIAVIKRGFKKARCYRRLPELSLAAELNNMDMGFLEGLKPDMRIPEFV